MSSKQWFRRAFGAALACASLVTFTAVSGPSAHSGADPGHAYWRQQH
ncbi:MAG: hypothetical protein ACKVG5_15370 [Acidimicrobiales bacterium]